MNKSKDIGEFLSFESTISRPSEEICKKILNLKDLLENQNLNSWRSYNVSSAERSYNGNSSEVQNYKRGGQNQSFQSLPSLSSSHYSPKTKPNYTKENISTRNAPTKYISKFKNSEKQVEDKILNTIILSKLNKFSESTYNEIRDFLHQILGSSNQIDTSEKDNIEEFVKEFMNLVFKKAASEEIFCPLYAKLLGEISKEYTIILDEMNKLHENYLNIFEEEEQTDNYDKFVERNKEKKYREGYSQFLSELIVYKILSVDKIVVIFKKIMDQLIIQGKIDNKTSITDQYIDCVLRITKVLQNKEDLFFVNIRKSLMLIVNDPIQNILDNKNIFISISTKSRFLLLNVLDYLKSI
jgi:hypothetical protein